MINLVKGQKIDLTKDSGEKLNTFCVGLNWSMIEKSGFFGKRREEVDLDASAAVFDDRRELIDVIYFGQLNSKDGAIQHSGDDLTGTDGRTDLDNEIIAVDLQRISSRADQIVFFLNSYKKQDFATIPYASIRLYEGTPTRVNRTFATLNVASDPKYAGHISMVMGKLYRRNGEWKFSSIGEATRDRDLKDTLRTIAQRYT